MSKVIGAVTRYVGTERRHLRGQTVEVVGIVKNGLGRNDQRILVTDGEILETGGVTTLDEVIVAVPIGGKDAMGGSVKATDLDCLRSMLRARGTA